MSNDQNELRVDGGCAEKEQLGESDEADEEQHYRKDSAEDPAPLACVEAVVLDVGRHAGQGGRFVAVESQFGVVFGMVAFHGFGWRVRRASSTAPAGRAHALA